MTLPSCRVVPAPPTTSRLRLAVNGRSSLPTIRQRIEAFDAQIAAMARVAGAGLATRDTGDFAGSGLTVINPWEAP